MWRSVGFGALDGGAARGVIGGGARVLLGPACQFAEGGGGVDGPVGIAEHFASQEDEVGFAVFDDAVGLGGFGDHADGGGGDVGLSADAGGEGDLVAGGDGDFGVGRVASRRAIDEVDGVFAKEAR